MCCFFTALLLFGPRLAILVWWIYSPVYITNLFQTWIWKRFVMYTGEEIHQTSIASLGPNNKSAVIKQHIVNSPYFV